MRTHVSTIAAILLCLGLAPGRAAADPITFSGSLGGTVLGARPTNQLELAFPDFRIVVVIEPQLTPPFPFFVSNGTAVSFDRSTGLFTGQSSSLAGPGVVDADVTGVLAFTGPSQVVDIVAPERSDALFSPIQLTGFLRIARPDHVFFDGALSGGGVGMVGYEDRFGRGDIRLEGYLFTFSGVATTPEPASLILVGSGLLWMARRRMRRAGSASGSSC